MSCPGAYASHSVEAVPLFHCSRHEPALLNGFLTIEPARIAAHSTRANGKVFRRSGLLVVRIEAPTLGLHPKFIGNSPRAFRNHSITFYPP
nr:MAG TPA: hypothetical protein [Caudoviricetes sp.]